MRAKPPWVTDFDSALANSLREIETQPLARVVAHHRLAFTFKAPTAGLLSMSWHSKPFRDSHSPQFLREQSRRFSIGGGSEKFAEPTAKRVTIRLNPKGERLLQEHLRRGNVVTLYAMVGFSNLTAGSGLEILHAPFRLHP